jgi:Tfp pilus assembly protein PilP
MVVRTSIVVVSILLLLLTACNQTAPNVVQNTGPTPTVPAPSGANATLSGQVVSNTNQDPIKETVVQLAQIYRDEKTQEAVYALDLARAPGTFTDQNGFFAITDVPPGEYAIIVGDYYGTNDVVQQNGNAQIFKTEAGKALDVGAIRVKPSVSPGK